MELFSISNVRAESLCGNSKLFELEKMFALGEIYVYTDQGVVIVSAGNAEANENNVCFENEFAKLFSEENTKNNEILI